MGDVIRFRILKHNDDPVDNEKFKMIGDLQTKRSYGTICLEFNNGTSIMIDATSGTTFRIWSDSLKFIPSSLPLRYNVDETEKANDQIRK